MKLFICTLASLVIAQVGFAQSYPSETAEAQNLIATTDKHSTYHYCVEGTLTCRSLVLLKSKATGARVADFYDVFLSSERAVGSTGYFVKNTSSNNNPNPRFHAYLDDVFNGVILINFKDMDNQNLRITFNNQGLPKVHNLTLKRVGTTRYVMADMTYRMNQATIVGTEYDTANPSYSTPVSVTYKRIH